MTVCVRCLVSGRVQGVFFRASTRRKAEELHINGWVRNLGDGRVEVFACGDESSVKSLQDWLWTGPPHAEVLEVKTEELEFQNIIGFELA